MKKRTYKTTTEAELRSLASQGLNWKQVAERLGLSLPRLRATVNVLGLLAGAHGRPRHSEETLLEWVGELARGATLEEVGTARGISRQAIHFGLKSRGLPTTCRGAVKKVNAAVAQSAEQPLCMVQVAGLSPARGSIDAESGQPVKGA